MERYQNYARLLPTPGTKVASATVTVYDVGTLNISAIYSDDLSTPTPKSNPFTTDSNGYYFFYAPNGRYDVRITGGTPAVTPYTLGDVTLGLGDGGVSSSTYDSLPTSTPTGAGRLMRVTDRQGTLWMDSGTGWGPVGTNVFNILRYGAKPGGVFNCATAIQAALDAAKAAGGGTVLIPSGVYGIGSASWSGLSLDSPVKVELVGVGTASTLKLLAVPTQTVSGYITSILFGPTVASQCRLADFSMDLNGLDAGGVAIQRGTGCVIENLYIANSVSLVPGATNTAIILSGGTYNHLRGCTTQSTSSAVQFGISTPNGHETDSEMSGCVFRASGGTNASHVVGGVITGNIFDGTSNANTACLEHVGVGTASTGWTISNNVFRGSAGNGLQVAALSTGLTTNGVISGNIFEQNGADGLSLFGGVSDIVVSGNLSRDNNFGGVGSGYGYQLSVAGGGGVRRVTFSGNVACDTRSGGSRTQSTGFNVALGSGSLSDAITDLIFVGNVARNHADRGFSFARDGGTVTGTRLQISSNIATENATFGIAITAGWTDVQMIGNTSVGNTAEDFRMSGSIPAGTVMFIANRYDTATFLTPQFDAFNRTSPSQEDFSVSGSFMWNGYTRIIGKIAPAQITSDQNNYNPSGFSTCSVLRINSDAARSITGFAGGSDGRRVTVYNNGGFVITLADLSASSSAANRILTGTGADYGLGGGASIDMMYESGQGVWRLIGTN